MAMDTEMEMEERRTSGSARVPVLKIRNGIEDLRRQPLHFTSVPELECGRSFDCYLTYSGRADMRALRLGPLAKWLIAIDLLTHEISDPLAKLHEALGVVDDEKVGRGLLRRMFGTRANDDPLRKASRFEARDIDARDETDRGVARVGEAVLCRLNMKFAARRGRQISIDDFLSVQVPLQHEADVLGDSPIEWFRHWLIWGIGTASVSTDMQPLRQRAEETKGLLQKGWDDLLPRLVDNQVKSFLPAMIGAEGNDAGSYEHIVNIHSEFSPGALDNFAAAAYVAICNAARTGRQAFDAPAVRVVYVSLRRGATCAQVLQQIYDSFQLDSTTLKAVHRGERGVDLAADLDPIRRAFTVNKVVVMFDGWETVPGPFGALHEYVCHTNWGEILRVLAQPHFSTVRAAPGEFRPSFQLMLLSRGKPAELGPWAHYVELSELWRQDAPEIDGLENDVLAGICAARPERRPNAPELALLRTLDYDARKGFVRRLGQGARHHWQDGLELMRKCIERCAFNEATALATCMIAGSVNGMRRGTLRRCMGEWDLLFASGQCSISSDDEFDELIKGLLAEKLPGIIVEVPDEEIEALSAEQQDFELDRQPRRGGRNADSGPPKVLAFATHELRGLFVSIWLESTARTKTTVPHSAARTAPRGSLECFPRCSWAHIQYLLAEEAIRQATSQSRHSTADSPVNPYSLSRAVQGLLHGLASLDLPARAFPEFAEVAGGLHGLALPADPRKRYRYLYGLWYRRVIEGGDWRLGRSFARSDLRLDILNLLLSPRTAQLVLGAGDMSTLGDTLPDYPFAPQSSTCPLSSIAEECRHDHELWSDLVEAVGHAGRDFGGSRGARAVDWTLARLPHATAPAEVNAALPVANRDCVSSETPMLKLRVDWYQSRGTKDELDAAASICTTRLSGLGIPEALITGKLYRGIDRALERARSNEDGVLGEMLACVADVQKHIETCTPTRPSRAEAAEFLFRFGEILATRADDLTEDSVCVTQEFARSFAVYWIADRVRSSIGSGALHAEGIEWPRATARAMRYYVRVTLKLARLISKEQPDEGTNLHRAATKLLEHAQTRSGVYTRHNFQFRRERDSMLTLEAARLRAWVRIGLERGAGSRRAIQDEIRRRRRVRPTGAAAPNAAAQRREEKRYRELRHAYLPGLTHLLEVLESSWRLLEGAEALLISGGFQTVHVRRLLLERTKTAIAFLYLGAAERVIRLDPDRDRLSTGFDQTIDTCYEIARSSLDALTAASRHHPFWQKIVKRQEDRLVEARGALSEVRRDSSALRH